jgi:hypothetical protein
LTTKNLFKMNAKTPPYASIKAKQLPARLRATLAASATSRASDLRAPLDVSQPTLSRLLNTFAPELLVIGKGPRIRYGLRRDVRGLGTLIKVSRMTQACDGQDGQPRI